MLIGLVARADEPTESPITSVGLYKNGLAMVQRTIQIPKPGAYIVKPIPKPMLGTFWIDAVPSVTARVRRSAFGEDELRELTGREAKIEFSDSARPEVSGTVRRIASLEGNDLTVGRDGRAGRAPILVIQSGDEPEVYVNAKDIVRITVAGRDGKTWQVRPEFILDVGAMNNAHTAVRLTYLTEGMAWTASYRIDLADAKNLAIRQSATIRNALADIKDAELRLVSGAPSLTSRSELADLFAGVNEEDPFRMGSGGGGVGLGGALGGGNAGQGGLGGGGFGGFGGGITNFNSGGVGRVAEDGGLVEADGGDVHEQAIGKFSILRGESVAVSTQTATAAYDRLVEWSPTVNYGDGPVSDSNAAWDAIQFRNPFKFPLTTGTVMFVGGTEFRGQTRVYFTSPGEVATLRSSKALSMLTEADEIVEKVEDTSFLWRNTKKKTHLGTLWIRNMRSAAMKVVIKRKVEGTLVDAEGEPQKKGGGGSSANPGVELVWNLTLEPGAEKRLNYRYTTIEQLGDGGAVKRRVQQQMFDPTEK